MTKSYPAKRFARLALAATIASGGVLAVPAPAGAATEVWVRISVYNSGLVAAVPSPYTTNNAQVVTAAYGDMAYNGQWELTEVATDTYTIENRFSHQCLDTENGGSQTAGTPVVQMPCDKSSSQKWVRTHDATLPVWHVSNYSSGLYLKVDNGSTAAGAGFIQANDLPNNTSEMIQMW
jgi:hypothetical protein